MIINAAGNSFTFNGVVQGCIIQFHVQMTPAYDCLCGRYSVQRQRGEPVHLSAASGHFHSDGKWPAQEHLVPQLQRPGPGQQTAGACGSGVGHRRKPVRGRFQLHPPHLPIRQRHQHHGAEVRVPGA